MANPIVAEEFGLTKKLLAWAERAAKQGLDLSTDLQSSIDDPVRMQCIVRCIRVGAPEPSVPGAHLVYDAAAVSRILGIPVECSDPAPEAEGGEIVVYYGGWDWKTLCTSPAGKKRMWQDWHEMSGWKAEPGYYRLLLPVPKSNRKTWSEQLRSLVKISATWQAAPICVAATALLVHLMETGNDLLKNDWCRCATEQLPGIHRAVLDVVDGRVRVSVNGHLDRICNDYLWLAASRKS